VEAALLGAQAGLPFLEKLGSLGVHWYWSVGLICVRGCS
jgi:hypothetical protein